MNYYEHHLGDYMRDTAHLSLLEDGAYRRLIDAYYVRERPLPIDLKECCKLARAVTKPERDAVAYVLKEFFERTEEGYRQKRCDEVLQKYLDKKNKAAASANARWSQCERNANASKTHMRTQCERNATHTHTQTHTHTSNSIQQTQTQKKPIRGSTSTPSVLFLAFWLKFPGFRKKDRKGAWAYWQKNDLDQKAAEVMRGLEHCMESADWTKERGQFVPAPLVWLRRDGWTDEMEPAVVKKKTANEWY
jgi:uncharacterized protein YdaU (DUF1376 family)